MSDKDAKVLIHATDDTEAPVAAEGAAIQLRGTRQGAAYVVSVGAIPGGGGTEAAGIQNVPDAMVVNQAEETYGLITAGVIYGRVGDVDPTGSLEAVAVINLNPSFQPQGGTPIGLMTCALSYGFEVANPGTIRGTDVFPMNADTYGADSSFGLSGCKAFTYGFDETLDQFEPDAHVSAASIGNVDDPGGAKLVAQVGNWAQHDEPAVATQATTTRAAVAGTRHVCTSISATLNAVAAVAAPISLYLRDGATGAGTILRSWRFIVPIGETVQVDISGLSIVGTENTAMTLEWGAAPGAGNFQNVSLSGYSVA